ncbi:UvrD-helicase domain-containing protein [Flavobacterium sp.]|uniref:UvrD-helicase domain-containing protein n=1 Tax=Flavobacterium sp. TaxID=239 RepID=UPI00391AEBE8
MKEQLKTWLLSQQDIIDKVVANASVNYYNDNKSNPNFKYDLKQCHIESYNLVRGKDLCYDRPNTAFAYTLWYHPRRINTFLSFFLDKVIQYQEQELIFFDLGAGAGAIQWSLGLIYAGLKRLGKLTPKITIVNIDSSPFMLYYNRDYLWKEFVQSYPEIDSEFKIEYEVNSWNNRNGVSTTNSFLVASYLFDDSDNQEEISKDFLNLVKIYKPSAVLLLTSEKKSAKYFPILKQDFIKLKYTSKLILSTQLLFNSPLKAINNIRSQLGKILNINELNRSTSWYDTSNAAIIFERPQLSIFEQGKRINNLDVFNPPITVRREVTLNDNQKKAAENLDRPVTIVGPAGCGKSIVITEKVRNIVEEHNYDPKLQILLTTFNKSLIKKLSEWLVDLLDKNKIRIVYDNDKLGNIQKSCRIYFLNSNIANIRLLHFDMLPKHIGSVNYRGMVNMSQHHNILNEIIQEVKLENKISNNQYDNILNADFIFEEYHRVIYGLQVGITGSEDTYLKVPRIGRGNNPSLQRNSDRRKIMFQCLKKYALRMHNEGIESFTLRRQYLLSRLNNNQVNFKYDYILVDEFQDCTAADFKIFYSLIKDPNKFTIGGDLAQSVHLGLAARIPRDENMTTRRNFKLDGSYRLPVRISECISGLSQAINKHFSNTEGTSNIVPYKGSPPGARPIVVYGENLDQLTDKLESTIKHYSIFDLRNICILERDYQLKNLLGVRGINVESDSILSLKGLEKECVIWATYIPLEFEKEVFEFAYTIVTRTSGILIIAITEQTQSVYKKVLGLLNKERLIFWDEISENKFNSFCENYVAEAIPDEDDEIDLKGLIAF